MKTSLVLKVFLGALLLCFLQAGNAQLYIQEKSQHRFAQTYLGLNGQYVPSSGKLFWKGGQSAFPEQFVPRLTLGGLHFWGHLDFNINIPLTRLGETQLAEGQEALFNTGGDLSARYFPWLVRFGKVRPFIGYSVNLMSLQLENSSTGQRTDAFITSSLLSGISFAMKNWQLQAEAMWLLANRRRFYTGRRQSEQFSLPPLYLSLGLVRYFDVTVREEKGMQSGRTQQLEKELLVADKLNSLTVGIAPSTAYFLRAPRPAEGGWKSLPRHKANFHFDLGLGYLLHKPGMHIGLSYRNYSSDVESYDLEQVIRRQSFAAEGFKFLWDYNGFVPFIGPSISYERWAAGEFEGDTQIGPTRRRRFVSPGIIFGWDIVASPLETWMLRTNLRYYPFQRIRNRQGEYERVDQLEFNIIQLVVYPQRMFHITRAKKRGVY